MMFGNRSRRDRARKAKETRRRKLARMMSRTSQLEALEDRRLLIVAPFGIDPGNTDDYAMAESAQVATDFTVDSFADAPDANPGDGLALTSGGVTTLRAAVMEANALEGDSFITLPAGTYTLTIAGIDEDAAATGDLDITDTAGSLTITGAGAATTTINAAQIDRVFHVLDYADLTVSGRQGEARIAVQSADFSWNFPRKLLRSP